MRKRKALLIILSLLTGLFVILTAFSADPKVLAVRAEFLHWASLLFAVLLFFAILDYVIACAKSPLDSSESTVGNFIVFAAFIGALLLGLLDGFDSPQLRQAVFTLQTSVETSLAALVCIGLIFALYRLPRQKMSLMKASFICGMFVFLLIYGGIFSYVPLPYAGERAVELIRLIPAGTLFGLLLGVAIGALVTGVRFLIFGKNPYREHK